jgi:hypothetical protein
MSETKMGSANDEAVDTNLPWKRSSVVKISITPKDFRIELVTHRKGTVPSIFPPKGQDNTEDNEKTTTVTVTGDLGIEIERQADGQGVEYHANDDDEEDWGDVASQAMKTFGEALTAGRGGFTAGRGGCFGGVHTASDLFTEGNPIPPHARTEPTDKPDAA